MIKRVNRIKCDYQAGGYTMLNPRLTADIVKDVDIRRVSVEVKIIKGGSNKADAKKMVNDYYDIAVRHGYNTVKELADAITGYAAV